LIQRLEYQNTQHMNDLLYDKLNKKLDILRHTQTQHSTQNRNYTSIHQQIPNSIHVSKICPTYSSTKKKKVYYN
jgi:hypothetical protein